MYYDGNIYFLKGFSSTPLKLGAGNFATGYVQTDGSINIYVSDNYNTTKYNLVLNSITEKFEINSTSTISDKDAIYEMYDGYYLIHSVTTPSWSVVRTL